MNWSEENLHSVCNFATPEEVFSHLKMEVKRMGMDGVSWVIRLPIPITDSRFVIFNNYSRAWEQRYYANNYLAVDPTVKHGMESTSPLLWSEVQSDAPDFWEDARSFGLSEGIVQSVWDRYGSCSMLSISRDSPKFSQSEIADKAQKVALLSHLVHSGMSRLILKKEAPETTASLSAREREIMKYVSTGKTSQEIADTLKLSKRTVDFHIDTIASKLGASNRVDAAVRAIVFGLV